MAVTTAAPASRAPVPGRAQLPRRTRTATTVTSNARTVQLPTKPKVPSPNTDAPRCASTTASGEATCDTDFCGGQCTACHAPAAPREAKGTSARCTLAPSRSRRHHASTMMPSAAMGATAS